MELWRHASEGKGPVLCNEIDPTTSCLARTRKVSMGWDTRKSCDFDSTLVSGRETIDSMEFMELGRPDVRGQSYISNQSLDAFGGEIGSNFSRKLPSPASMLLSNSSFGKYESGSSLSSPVTESNSRNSSLNDRTNLRQAKNCGSGFVLSSVGSSLTSKRARAANLYSPNPVCQVHGCNKDLSSSKDYHKRHKVCDVHSKTAKVIVNGIEQRFCQQCSRFHLLAEFDDGKRSCRKRLAGHNERRRKPQLDVLSGKPQKLLQVYEGARFLQANTLAKRSSFASLDTLGSGSRGNELANESRVKAEEVPICSPHLMMLTANRQLLSRPVFHQNGRGNEYSSEKISSQTGCASLGAASTIQAVSGVSNSKGALSLLSPQPKELLSHLTGIPMVSPLVMPVTNALSYEDQNSEIFEGVSIGEKLSPNGFWPGMNSMAFDQLQPPLVFDASCGANSFEVQVGGVCQRSDSIMKSQSPQQGPTVDLVQLSLHLQRVEQQRNSVQMKQENDVFCSFPSVQGLRKQLGMYTHGQN